MDPRVDLESVVLTEEPVVLDGCATRVVDAPGDPDATAFVFVHGFSDSADTWQRVQRRLSAAGHGSSAVDLPSHGRAARLDLTRPTMDQMVGVARAAAERLGDGRKVVLVGNSLGGATVLLVAERHPEVTAGVVPIGPAGFELASWLTGLARPGINAITRGVLSQRVRPLTPVVAMVVAEGVRLLTFGQVCNAPRGWSRDWGTNVGRRGVRMQLLEVGLGIRDELLNDPFDLEAIEAPIMCIWGSRDRLALPRGGKQLLARRPDARMERLEAIGHMPQVEAPGRTTKLLVDFADQLAVTS